jgi:DegV family protein with EDD domain
MSEKRIAIVTDSAAYLPEDLAARYKIHVIPLWIFWGEDRIKDGVDIQPTEFYKRLQGSELLPTTSQPSAGEFIEFYKTIVNGFSGIVSVHISSKLSGTIGSALAAVNQFLDVPIQVVDSLNVSMGMGFVVLAAAKAAAEGKDIEQVAAAARSMVKRTQLLFVVDTLEYLHKGGRISGAKAWLGTALSIKPLLHFEEGMIQPLVQVRTKKKGIATMLEKAEERLAGKPMAAAAVVDCNSPTEGDAVAQMVKERFGVEEVLRSPISPAVGVHAGPGAVGLAFYAEE